MSPSKVRIYNLEEDGVERDRHADCLDATMARLLDQAGVDALLVE